MTPRRLTLIRHPRPAVAPGVCYGRSDLPLAGDAAACAATLRPQLPAGGRVFTSPLRRCRELALALRDDPVIDARLIEMDFGDWELRRWDELPRAQLDAWASAPLDFAPPGGEPVSAVLGRVRSFLAEYRNAGAIAIVTHAGVMKLFAAELLGLPQAQWLAMRFPYGEPFPIGF